VIAHTYFGFGPLRSKQGDQIGRIFAQWTSVTLGSFFDNYKSGPHFVPLFPSIADYVPTNFDKKRVGLHFGRFFTNSSGHPGSKTPHSAWWLYLNEELHDNGGKKIGFDQVRPSPFRPNEIFRLLATTIKLLLLRRTRTPWTAHSWSPRVGP
jgi:hypothetical protein